MNQTPIKIQNRIFDFIPDAEWDALSPHIEEVCLQAGGTVYGQGEKINYIYFPSTAIVTILYGLENGSSAGIAFIGSEGLVGASIFMGSEKMSSKAITLSPGLCYRIKTSIVLGQFNHCGTLMRLFLRYYEALIAQMTQTAVCNRHHTLCQQLCRCLLMSADCLSTNELMMTHASIANMLGSRREGVTEAAQKIQNEGLIKYCRGHITILDHQGLQRRACECYKVVKMEYDRLLTASSFLRPSAQQ